MKKLTKGELYVFDKLPEKELRQLIARVKDRKNTYQTAINKANEEIKFLQKRIDERVLEKKAEKK